MEYEYSLAACPSVVHQRTYSELTMNLTCNCQFDAKISPLHILTRLTLFLSFCLSLSFMCLSHTMPCQAKFTLHTGGSGMPPLRDHVPFIFSQECRPRGWVCSHLFIKQNARTGVQAAKAPAVGKLIIVSQLCTVRKHPWLKVVMMSRN